MWTEGMSACYNADFTAREKSGRRVWGADWQESARGLVFHDDKAVARFKIKRATRVRFSFLFFRKIALSIQHSCPIPSS